VNGTEEKKMSGNGGGKFPPDPRLVFAANPYNGRSGARRSILSTDIVEYEPVVRARDWSELIEFELKPDRAWLFGPMTKFQITGKFVRERYIAAVPPVDAVGVVGEDGYVAGVPGQPERYEPQDTVPDDRADLLLGQNWWELLVKQFSIYHKFIDMKTTNELPSMKPFLNSLLYVLMDDQSKLNLGQVNCHPIFALDPVRGQLRRWRGRRYFCRLQHTGVWSRIFVQLDPHAHVSVLAGHQVSYGRVRLQHCALSLHQARHQHSAVVE
jgi:hypothetical protein